METVQGILNNWWLVLAWVAATALCVATLLYDLKANNPEIKGLMKFVWIFTTAYSGPLGLWVYWKSGRKQISRDSLWRRAARSVSHCYSGCGMGEIAGVLITAGLLSLANLYVTVVTFLLAYVAGFVLTAGPLIQDGESVGDAVRDAFYSETASITVMELVAISTNLLITRSATISDPVFWSSLVISLTVGLAAAYPVNILLIHFGIKEGMHDPRQMAAHA